MESSKRTRAFSWGALIFATVFALVCVIFILTGVVGSGVWWTVAAMVLLALSNVMSLVSEKRRALTEQS